MDLDTPKTPIPRCSMCGIFTYVYHKFRPNVGKYTIHWASGILNGWEWVNHSWHLFLTNRNPSDPVNGLNPYQTWCFTNLEFTERALRFWQPFNKLSQHQTATSCICCWLIFKYLETYLWSKICKSNWKSCSKIAPKYRFYLSTAYNYMRPFWANLALTSCVCGSFPRQK